MHAQPDSLGRLHHYRKSAFEPDLAKREPFVIEIPRIRITPELLECPEILKIDDLGHAEKIQEPKVVRPIGLRHLFAIQKSRTSFGFGSEHKIGKAAGSGERGLEKVGAQKSRG